MSHSHRCALTVTVLGMSLWAGPRGSEAQVVEYERNATAWKAAARCYEAYTFDEFFPGKPDAVSCLLDPASDPAVLHLASGSLTVSAERNSVANCAIRDGSTPPAVSDASLTDHLAKVVFEFDPPVVAFYTYYGSMASGTRATMKLYSGGSLVDTLTSAVSPDDVAATGHGFLSSTPIERIEFTTTDTTGTLVGAFTRLVVGESSLGTRSLTQYPGPNGSSTIQLDFACSFVTPDRVHNATKDTWHPCLRDAISLAVNGDVLVAEPSVYSEAIDFQGKAITLTSTDPGNPQVVASTILDATVFQSSAVRCASGEGSGTVIDGLTISGGAAVNGGGLFVGPAAAPVVKRSTFVGNLAQFGGGIYESPGSAPTVVDCTFNNNTATSRGGGIYMNQAGPSLAGCEFQANSAQFGGGVYVLGTSPAITDCRFLHNNALTRGGGLFVQDASPTVAHCLFEGNSAISQGGGLSGFPGGSGHVTITESRFAFNGAGGDGGAVWCDTTRFTIQQCDFEKNQAARGAALFLSGPAPQPFDVRGCRFFGNVASNLSGGPGKSAVLFVKSTNDQTAHATVHQCLFSGNIGSGITAEGDSALVDVTSCTLAHGRLASVAANASALVQLRNCILWGDTLPEIVTELEGKVLWTYCNIQGLGGAGGQAPNYDFDPRFADAAGPDGVPGTADDDLHLTAGSPCVNAGQGVHNPNNPQFDFDGTPRSQGGSTDLGAYEFPIDCDASGTPDYVEIQEGALADCNGNLQYDECESVLDCNRNGIMDECDIKSGLLHDTNGNGFADECEVGGILSGTNQWSLSNRAIVFVTQDLTVTGSLTIHPGVLVRFASNVKMTVFNAGHLMVAGSASEPVVFTSWKPRPAAGDWGGLRFAAGSSGSLTNAVIGYSRNHGVRIEGPSVPVQYCTIHDVSGADQPAGTASNPAQPGGPAYGIYLTGNASSTILGNTIERLSGGTGGRGAAGRSGDTGNFGSNGLSAGQSGGKGLNAVSAGLPGAAGAIGGEAVGIYCGPQSNPTLRNNVVRRVRGGDGGDGGYGGWGGGGGEGGSGMMGDPTPDSIQFWVFQGNPPGTSLNGGNGGDGGNAKDGSVGGNGAAGGAAAGIRLDGVAGAKVEQNLIADLAGGAGGRGGTGGTGGSGGNGGDGGAAVYIPVLYPSGGSLKFKVIHGDPGKGGDGGNGGNAGNGGAGGDGGTGRGLDVISISPLALELAQTTVAGLSNGPAGEAGETGAAGRGGTGGRDGNQQYADTINDLCPNGVGACKYIQLIDVFGGTGIQGTDGLTAADGPGGSAGEAQGVVTTGSGLSVKIANMVLHSASASNSVGATALGGSLLLVDFTILSNFQTPFGPGTSNQGLGNLFVDPMFTDPTAGDFYLAAGSPAIDAGNNASVPAGLTTDLDGRPRIFDGDGIGPAIVDLGAYEFIPSFPGDFDRDGDVDGADYDHFVACALGPAVALAGPACADADLDGDGDGDQGDFGLFQRCFSGANIPADPNCRL